MFRFSLLRRAVTGGLLALLAGTALIMALPGYAQDSATVSTVNGEAITRTEFHARVRLVRWQYLRELEKFYELTGGNLGLSPDYVNNLLNNLQNPATLGDSVLSQMEEERLLWQKGASLNLTPSDTESQLQEAQFFSLWTNVAVADLSGSADAQAFIQQWYAGATVASGMSQDDVRHLFATEALRTKLYNYVASSVPTEEPAVHTRHILCAFKPQPAAGATPTPEVRVAAQGCIQAAQARLQSGEAFESVAAALSDDTASAAQGGDVGWTLLSYLDPNYANAVRDAALNTLIGPVESQYGFHLIEVLERRTQKLTDQELADSRDGYFKLWLQSLHTQAAVQRSPDWNTGLPADPALDTLDPKVLDAVTKFMSQSGK